jgi:putative transposase
MTCSRHWGNAPSNGQRIGDIDYPFQDKIFVVTNCGCICLGHKKINFSTVFAGQAGGIKEVHDDIGSSALRIMI